MFIYYEKFIDPDPSKCVYDLVISSDGRTQRIDWKNIQHKAVQDLCSSLFKQVPLTERDFNETTKVWTFLGFRGDVIITGLKSLQIQGLFPGVVITQIEDLSKKVELGRLNKKTLVDAPIGTPKYSVDDFFYTPPASNTELALSGNKLYEALAPLLGITVELLISEKDDSKLKKLYRSSAMRLHPDRNNGDGSRMSELNMLWNIFMQRV